MNGVKTAAKKLSTTSERTIIKEKIIVSSLLNMSQKHYLYVQTWVYYI